MFSLSDRKFSLCQFTRFVTITYTKLTWQTNPVLIFFKNFVSLQISKYLLPLESGNFQLEQTKFPMFWQNFQIPCVFPDRDFFEPFSLFCLTCSAFLLRSCSALSEASNLARFSSCSLISRSFSSSLVAFSVISSFSRRCFSSSWRRRASSRSASRCRSRSSSRLREPSMSSSRRLVDGERFFN